MNNIFPIFDRMLRREDKESYLKQKAIVIWIVGLSGSGKSTIAIALEHKLRQLGYFTQILDGDNIRSGINNNLSFSPEDRIENIRRIAEVSKLFLNCGVITINSFITPSQEMRDLAKKVIGNTDFFEIFVDTPIEECERRDVKGLYKLARAGKIKDFTGVNAPFDIPVDADLRVETIGRTPEEIVDDILVVLNPRITFAG